MASPQAIAKIERERRAEQVAAWQAIAEGNTRMAAALERIAGALESLLVDDDETEEVQK